MTLQEWKDRLASYLAAEAAILKAQEYAVGQGSTARRLTRADLAEVRAGINEARVEVDRLESAQKGVRRVRYLRPRC